jgi:hypothetical protein
MPIKSETVTIERVEYQEKEVKHIEVPCMCGGDGCNIRMTIFECAESPGEYNLSLVPIDSVYAGPRKQIIMTKLMLNHLAYDILEFIKED